MPWKTLVRRVRPPSRTRRICLNLIEELPMGRPAKSQERHWLDSTKSQVGKTNGPAAFVGGRPKYPKHLSSVAKKAYKRAVQLLENRRTLVPSDEVTLELFASTYALWIQAKAECAGD